MYVGVLCFQVQRRVGVRQMDRWRTLAHCKNERSFQPFLGYLSCFCSCFYNGSHSKYTYTQLTISHSKHPPVWFPAPSMYKRIHKRENYGSGEIQHLGTGVIFGTGPKAFISVVQCFGKGPGIVIIALYIPHSHNNKTNL